MCVCRHALYVLVCKTFHRIWATQAKPNERVCISMFEKRQFQWVYKSVRCGSIRSLYRTICHVSKISTHTRLTLCLSLIEWMYRSARQIPWLDIRTEAVHDKYSRNFNLIRYSVYECVYSSIARLHWTKIHEQKMLIAGFFCCLSCF